MAGSYAGDAQRGMGKSNGRNYAGGSAMWQGVMQGTHNVAWGIVMEQKIRRGDLAMTEHRAYAEKRKRGGPEVKHGQSEVKPVSSPTDSGSLTFESLTHHTPSTPNRATGIQGSEDLFAPKCQDDESVKVLMVEKEHCQPQLR